MALSVTSMRAPALGIRTSSPFPRSKLVMRPILHPRACCEPNHGSTEAQRGQAPAASARSRVLTEAEKAARNRAAWLLTFEVAFYLLGFAVLCWLVVVEPQLYVNSGERWMNAFRILLRAWGFNV